MRLQAAYQVIGRQSEHGGQLFAGVDRHGDLVDGARTFDQVFGAPLLRLSLLKEARVINGDRGLLRDGPRQLLLIVGKRANLARIVQRHHPDRAPLAYKRQQQH